jgi:hypothetical protein
MKSSFPFSPLVAKLSDFLFVFFVFFGQEPIQRFSALVGRSKAGRRKAVLNARAPFNLNIIM